MAVATALVVIGRFLAGAALTEAANDTAKNPNNAARNFIPPSEPTCGLLTGNPVGSIFARDKPPDKMRLIDGMNFNFSVHRSDGREA